MAIEFFTLAPSSGGSGGSSMCNLLYATLLVTGVLGVGFLILEKLCNPLLSHANVFREMCGVGFVFVKEMMILRRCIRAGGIS